MTEHDQQLSDLLERAARRLDPDVEALVAGGVARGRQRRAGRAVGVGAAVVSVVTVALVGVVGGMVGGQTTSRPDAVAVPSAATQVDGAAPSSRHPDVSAVLIDAYPGATRPRDRRATHHGTVHRGSVRWHGLRLTATVEATAMPDLPDLPQLPPLPAMPGLSAERPPASPSRPPTGVTAHLDGGVRVHVSARPTDRVTVEEFLHRLSGLTGPRRLSVVAQDPAWLRVAR